MARVCVCVRYDLFLPHSATRLTPNDTTYPILIFVVWFYREYAPKFALRSYFFLLPSVGAAKASEAFLSLFGLQNDKPQVSSPFDIIAGTALAD